MLAWVRQAFRACSVSCVVSQHRYTDLAAFCEEWTLPAHLPSLSRLFAAEATQGFNVVGALAVAHSASSLP